MYFTVNKYLACWVLTRGHLLFFTIGYSDDFYEQDKTRVCTGPSHALISHSQSKDQQVLGKSTLSFGNLVLTQSERLIRHQLFSGFFFPRVGCEI